MIAFVNVGANLRGHLHIKTVSTGAERNILLLLCGFELFFFLTSSGTLKFDFVCQSHFDPRNYQPVETV